MRSRKIILLLLLLVLVNLSCVSFAKPGEIIYLIPEGFTGGVIVIFNQPDGITPEIDKDGAIIYRVPKDGIIKIKEPYSRIASEYKYFFVDAQGKRTPIEYLYPRYYVRNQGEIVSKSFDTISEDETNNKIFAMIHTTTNFGEKEGKVYINNFIVGKPKEYQILYLKTSDKIDEIQTEILKAKTVRQ